MKLNYYLSAKKIKTAISVRKQSESMSSKKNVTQSSIFAFGIIKGLKIFPQKTYLHVHSIYTLYIIDYMPKMSA